MMSQSEQMLKDGVLKNSERNRVLHAMKRIVAEGLIDLLLGFCLRSSISRAGIILVTPGWPLPRIVNKGGYIEASYARFFPGVRIECLKGAVVTIGRGTYLNRNTEIVAFGSVTIGNECKIARDVIVMDTDQHPVGNNSLKIKPVSIEDRVWIGSRAIILKGVTIGHDSIVGAGAVVTKSIPPHSIVANPAAKIIKSMSDSYETCEVCGAPQTIK